MKIRLGLVLLLSVSCLRADVTLRYTSTNQFTSALPAGIMDEAVKQRGVQMPDSFTVQLKGTKGYSKIGNLEFITDLTTREATLLDRDGRRYATAPMKEVAAAFSAAMPQMSSQAQKMLGAMKGDFVSKKTGRTETILGIEAEETEGTLTVGGAAPIMKMVVQFWTAKPADVQRIGSLREFTAYTQRSAAFFSPAAMIRQMTGKVAGFAQGIADMIDEIQKSKSVLLKSHMEMQMPFMAQMAKKDPKEPFVTIDQLLTEISDAPIADSVFAVPEGVQAVPMADLVKSLLPAAAFSNRRMILKSTFVSNAR